VGAPSPITIQSWRAGELKTSTDVADLWRFLEAPDSRTWVDLSDADAELVEATARKLGLHPLVART
jgi:hypothetical protein